MCGVDAVCPAGKGAAEWRAAFWRVAEKAGFRCVLPIRKDSRRAGGAGNGLLPARNGVFPARRLLYVLPMSLSPQETEIRPISQTKRAPYSCKTFHVYPSAANAALYKSLLIAPSFRGEHPARPKPSFPRPQNPNFPPFPPPSHPPTIPQGERRALPAPAQGSRPLRIPFWERLRFPPFTPSPTPQAASPCSWTCRRVRALPPDRNETKQVRPLLMGRTCVTHAPTALAAGPAG